MLQIYTVIRLFNLGDAVSVGPLGEGSRRELSQDVERGGYSEDPVSRSGEIRACQILHESIYLKFVRIKCDYIVSTIYLVSSTGT